MKFEYLGGGPIEAPTDLELVEAMRLDAMEWAPSVSIEDYMEDVAKRCQVYKGLPVRADSVRNFLFDMQVQGYLVPENPWAMLAVDGIKLALFGPIAPAAWTHQLIWSSDLPFVVSTHTATGATVHRPIHLSEIATPGFQEQWSREHLESLRRQQ